MYDKIIVRMKYVSRYPIYNMFYKSKAEIGTYCIQT